MSTRAAAEAAIEKMDNTELDGRTIRVNESRPKGSAAAPRGPGGAGGFNVSGREDVKLYVGNLSFNTVEADIRAEFEKYGTVKDCFMPTDRDSGKVRGFCFVTMPAAAAEVACEKMNGVEIDGRALRVNEAQPKGGGGGGRGTSRLSGMLLTLMLLISSLSHTHSKCVSQVATEVATVAADTEAEEEAMVADMTTVSCSFAWRILA